MARQWTRIWDQTAPNRGGAGVGGRRDFSRVQQSAIINPYYYGDPNNPISQVAAHEKNMAITGRTPLESAAKKQFAGTQILNMPLEVQQAIAEQENAIAYHTGGQGTSFTAVNPYTNPNLSRDEQNAIAQSIEQAQQKANTRTGVPATPKAIAHVQAYLDGYDNRTEAQNQVLREQLVKQYGMQLDSVPAWRQHSAEAKARFEQKAIASVESWHRVDPSITADMLSINPETGEAEINDKYRAYLLRNEREQKQLAVQSKAQVEQKKSQLEANEGLLKVYENTATLLEEMGDTEGAAQIKQRMTSMLVQRSKLLAGEQSAPPAPQQQATQQAAPASGQPAATQPAVPQSPSPQVMRDFAALGEQRALAGKTVELPGGRVIIINRNRPFSSGQFSIPDEPAVAMDEMLTKLVEFGKQAAKAKKPKKEEKKPTTQGNPGNELQEIVDFIRANPELKQKLLGAK